MPAKKKTTKTTSKKSVKKTAAKKSVTKKKTNRPKEHSVKSPTPRIITISKKPAFISEKARESLEIKPSVTLSHKPRSIDGMIGSAEFKEGVASPRLKIQPKSLQPKTVNDPISEIARNTASENPIIKELASASKEDVDHTETSLEMISLEDPVPVADPFAEVLDTFDEHDDYHQESSQEQAEIEPDAWTNLSTKTLADEAESPKVYDTKHYHVPIRSRALKTGSMYLLEFIIIAVLIAVFLAILIDAEIYNPGFELPFDML